jgi:hypothetical protein
MVILIAQHCLRRRDPASESTPNIILFRPLPYRGPEVHARSLPAAIRVSAGVSRKRVHLFRWGSYFHKAFTGTKKTTSRERLPNPCSPCRNLPFRSRTRAGTSRRTDIDTIRTVDIPPLVLINRRHHFLIWSPEPFGPCPPGHKHSPVIIRESIGDGGRFSARHARLAGHIIETNPHAVMTAALPLLRGATSRTLWKKEYDHGSTDRGSSGHRFRIV